MTPEYIVRREPIAVNEFNAKLMASIARNNGFSAIAEGVEELWSEIVGLRSELAEELATREMLDAELAKVSALLASHSETSHSTCSAHLADVLGEVSSLAESLREAREMDAKVRVALGSPADDRTTEEGVHIVSCGLEEAVNYATTLEEEIVALRAELDTARNSARRLHTRRGH